MTAVAKALQWVKDNLDAFDPFTGENLFDVQHGKRLNELAITLYCYVHLTGDRDSDVVQQSVAVLKAVQQQRAFTDRLVRFPEEFALVCDIYGVLRLLGHDDIDQHTLIQRVIDAGLLASMERVPHRMLDVRLSLEWGNFHHGWPSMETLYASSLLMRVPSALYLTDAAAYTLTHILFFVSGFGTRTTLPVPSADLPALRHTLGMLLITYCQQQHWDLVGEVLLCWECLGLESTVVVRQGWDAFYATQRDDGAFPGPQPAVASRAACDEQPDAARVHHDYFQRHYHTTLVGIMAGTLHAARARSPNTVRCAGSSTATGTIRPTQQPGRAHTDVTHAMRQARSWLEQLVAVIQPNTNHAPTTACYILVGWWICTSLLGTDEERRSSDVPYRVWQTLVDHPAPLADPSHPMPPALKLLVGGLLSAYGLAVPALDDFTRQAVEALNAIAADDALADVLLCEKRVLLHARNLHPMPQLADYAAVMHFARTFSLESPVSAINDLLLRIESLTGYGIRPMTLAPADMWVQDLLVGLAVHYLRTYDFLLGCRIMRALVYLGADGAASVEDCLAFLILHQRPEGAFGFFGPEEAALHANVPGRFASDERLYLPVTISCLLALGEGAVAHQWRLYTALASVCHR